MYSYKSQELLMFLMRNVFWHWVFANQCFWPWKSWYWCFGLPGRTRIDKRWWHLKRSQHLPALSLQSWSWWSAWCNQCSAKLHCIESLTSSVSEHRDLGWLYTFPLTLRSSLEGSLESNQNNFIFDHKPDECQHSHLQMNCC